jgi:PH (Pleckstrin Homology) domain-containing protein
MARKTFEMLLSRIESIGVVQPVWGPMLGCGTVILRGVGGTPNEFDLIAKPLAFRSHVQEQIETDKK